MGGMVWSTLLVDPVVSAALEGDQLLRFKPQSNLFISAVHRVTAVDDVPAHRVYVPLNSVNIPSKN